MMNTISNELKLLFQLNKTQTLLARRFDAGLGGLGLNEFMILYHLQASPEQKMRRIDLANKIGLTASGVTRLLLPMEKIGLVSKEINKLDARVSFVVLALGGRRKFEEGDERAELLLKEIMPQKSVKEINSLQDLLTLINGAL
jgi:DNA-binding MarR family transcriptional regulator